ncbi:MAG: hypothetical protein K1000chlam3_00233 [Chlamydiae bacterium]|nr:hypothetical protein [Chlamydiota bacterium]
MRYAFFFLVAVVSFLGKGIADEKLDNEFRVNLNPEKLSIREDGIFLITESYGEVALSNLQIDERGYYTICQIAYICTNCQNQYEQHPDTCDCCGSQEMDFVGIGKENADEYLTIQAMLATFLNNYSIWEGKILLCGTAVLQGDVDSDGNKSISLRIEDTNDDKDITYGAGGSIKQDEDGEVSAKAEFTLKIGF